MRFRYHLLLPNRLSVQYEDGGNRTIEDGIALCWDGVRTVPQEIQNLLGEADKICAWQTATYSKKWHATFSTVSLPEPSCAPGPDPLARPPGTDPAAWRARLPAGGNEQNSVCKKRWKQYNDYVSVASEWRPIGLYILYR